MIELSQYITHFYIFVFGMSTGFFIASYKSYSIQKTIDSMKKDIGEAVRASAAHTDISPKKPQIDQRKFVRLLKSKKDHFLSRHFWFSLLSFSNQAEAFNAAWDHQQKKINFYENLIHDLTSKNQKKSKAG